jgi:hypothetical protein
MHGVISQKIEVFKTFRGFVRGWDGHTQENLHGSAIRLSHLTWGKQEKYRRRRRRRRRRIKEKEEDICIRT